MLYDYVTNRTAYENLHQLQVFEAGQLLGDGAEHVSIQIPGQRNTSDCSENRTNKRRLFTIDADATGGKITAQINM